MMQDLDGLKSFLKDYVERITRKSGRGMYVCPLCGSGDGPNRTGAFSVDSRGGQRRWKCFSCGKGGDLFDLYGEVNGCDGSDAARALLAMYGKGESRRGPSPREQGKPRESRGQAKNYAKEIAAFHEALAGSEGESYLRARGLTSNTMRRFELGYDAAKHAVTIPYDRQGTYYARRNTRPGQKHNNLTGVRTPVFNADALYTDGACFIVESPLCAISITQEGGAAAAVSGTSGLRSLMERLIQRPPTATPILSLDNDGPGRRAQAELAGMMGEAGLFFLEANVAGEHNDPNEALQKDAQALRERIAREKERAVRAREAREADAAYEAGRAAEAYQRESAQGAMDAFTGAINASIDTPAIATGFKGLDAMLEGGLYEGLYIVGAVSSLGKTTFVLQVADQVAAAGQDVLIFSLEMARNELIAKSISRLTYMLAKERELPANMAKTTRGITTGKRYARYGGEEIRLIEDAKEAYRKTFSSHLWIWEGVGNIGAAQIRDAVKRHAFIRGRPPVVMVDYLQILEPSEMRATDKQNTDKSVLELKRISRDYKIPVIGISSFNRDNYTAPVNMAAFKESGAIEYSSDVLIGLQYRGMDYRDGEADGARQKRIRGLFKTTEQKARAGQGLEIDLKVLKNRNGGRGMSDPLTYYPWFNCFVEHPEGFETTDEATPFTRGGKRM